MVKLRLRRTGKTHLPSYQIVAIDSRKARDARHLEKIGHYYPLMKKYDFEKEKVLKWLEYGAQPTKVVEHLLKKSGIWEIFRKNKQADQSTNKKIPKGKQENQTKS